MSGREVSREEIQNGRRYTAMLIGGSVALSNVIGIRHIVENLHNNNVVGQRVGIGVLAVGAIISGGVGYLYWDGDGDLSPHRDQARHFNRSEEPPHIDTATE